MKNKKSKTFIKGFTHGQWGIRPGKEFCPVFPDKEYEKGYAAGEHYYQKRELRKLLLKTER